MVGLEWYPCCRLKPATRIPLSVQGNLSLCIIIIIIIIVIIIITDNVLYMATTDG